jgi:hypothetical protein
LRKMVLLRWSVGAVGAGSVPGGAVGGARFGVLRLGEGRVPSRDCVGRGEVYVAGERSVGVGMRLFGRPEKRTSTSRSREGYTWLSCSEFFTTAASRGLCVQPCSNAFVCFKITRAAQFAVSSLFTPSVTTSNPKRLLSLQMGI